MDKVNLRIIFIDCECEQPVIKILDDLVTETIKRVVNQHPDVHYIED